MTDQAILDILLAEVKPALGCTGPLQLPLPRMRWVVPRSRSGS